MQIIKSNTNKFYKLMEDHILEYYSKEELKQQLESLQCNRLPTIEKQAYYMVTGGCFLIYNHEIIEFYVNTFNWDKIRLEKHAEDAKLLNTYANNIASTIKRMFK